MIKKQLQSQLTYFHMTSLQCYHNISHNSNRMYV